jgi:hypothetical protein
VYLFTDGNYSLYANKNDDALLTNRDVNVIMECVNVIMDVNVMMGCINNSETCDGRKWSECWMGDAIVNVKM